jgi:glutamate---cysteine ligase / carboxylate-amine ligase
MSGMPPQTEAFTIGVEEEYQIIDPQTRQLCPRSQHLFLAAQSRLGETILQPEFRQSQIEIATPICRSLQEVRTQLTRLRREVIAAADQAGKQIVAAGTHPFSHWQTQLVTPKPSYEKLVQRYQHLMHELVTFGCHVHVGVSDREIAVQILNRARIWLTPLLALSASSPFWLGQDTGYASYRSVLINRLPMAGVPLIFESYQAYQAMVQTLITTQTIFEPTQVCWDLRLSERFPTLEFRLSDMCMTVDEAVLIAGLVRGLVRTCYEHACLDVPYRAVRPELLRAAHWCAARSGLEMDLIDIETERPIPAQALIEQFLEFIRPALKAFGEWDEVSTLAHTVMQQGTGAARQRNVYQQTGSLLEVIDFCVAETAK